MKVVDLFAGSGGLSLGFQNVGFTVVAAYDSWPLAIECYKANFKHPIFQLDLSNVSEAVEHISQWNASAIIGGPPCQDFSHAGKRSEGDRARLTMAFAQTISLLKPHLFVMENVDRASKSNVYIKARKIFKKAGYGLTERVLNASKCGVPQVRKRFFCIGLIDAKDDFLGPLLDSSVSDNTLTVQEYLGAELGIDYYYRHPRNYNRRGIFSIHEPAPTVRGVNRPIPKGYVGHPNDPVPVTDSVRPLTTLERARIQTFPTNFVWKGKKTELEQMIGNAVPVKLAEFVASAILSYMQSEEGEQDRVASGGR